MHSSTSRLSTPFRKYGDVFITDSCRHDKVFLSQEDASCQGAAGSWSGSPSRSEPNWRLAAKKYTSSHREVVRAKIVLLSQGLGNDRIAEADEYTEFVVALPRQMFATEGGRA